jgi:hypothetical protein
MVRWGRRWRGCGRLGKKDLVNVVVVAAVGQDMVIEIRDDTRH